MIDEEALKEKIGWKFTKYDVRWNKTRVMWAQILGFFVGLLASAVGLGGGVQLFKKV